MLAYTGLVEIRDETAPRIIKDAETLEKRESTVSLMIARKETV